MPKSEENWERFTEEEARLWRETVKTGEDMRRMLQYARRAQAARGGRRAERTMALNRGGAAVYAIGRDIYRVPEADGAKSGDRGGGQAGGRRAARRVHDAARQSGEGEPGAAMRYPRSGGKPCRAPKVRGQKYCNMHLAMEAARPTKFSLPALDDANSIQVALTKQRKDWWMAHWTKKWPRSWPTFYKWR